MRISRCETVEQAIIRLIQSVAAACRPICGAAVSAAPGRRDASTAMAGEPRRRCPPPLELAAVDPGIAVDRQFIRHADCPQELCKRRDAELRLENRKLRAN